tara:strand:- start:456 stop:614 length:159 start_codon:yes stop_codon:yes gene_type:complete
MSEYAYKEALKRDFIKAVRQHVKMWIEYDCVESKEHMQDIAAWVHEIWGDEE